MKIDIRTKMLISVVSSMLALIYNDIIIMAVLFIISLLILFLFKIPIYRYGKFKKLLLLYMGLIIIQSIFVHSGEPLIVIGRYSLLTVDGLVYGGIVVLRFMIFLACGLLLLNNTNMELITALSKLKIPDEIIIMIMVGIRFFPVILEDIQSTLNFIQLRGVNLKKIYKRKVLKVYIKIFYPIVYSIWCRAEKISMLMELRGFRSYDTRVYYREIKLSKIDYAIMSFTLLGAVLFIYLSNKYYGCITLS